MTDPSTYQFLRDFYLVWVDSIWESGKTKSGLITSNTAIQNNVEELEDRGSYKRRYGKILEVPASFSDNPVEEIDPGLPKPKAFIGHDWIEHQSQIGHRGYRLRENPQSKYYPSTFESIESIKFKDIKRLLSVKVGDTVYFEHFSTDVERYMGPYDGGHLFSVQANEILCVLGERKIFESHSKYKRKEIHPQGGWVFVRINMETWEDITLPSGIIMKVAPEALPLQGRIVASQRADQIGKDVLFERDADAPITVDSKELTCMRQSDILAILRSGA